MPSFKISNRFTDFSANEYNPWLNFHWLDEFFNEKTVDEGALFGFHRMNAFTGMTPLESMHFHDIEKNTDVPRDLALYKVHVSKLFKS